MHLEITSARSCAVTLRAVITVNVTKATESGPIGSHV